MAISLWECDDTFTVIKYTYISIWKYLGQDLERKESSTEPPVLPDDRLQQDSNRSSSSRQNNPGTFISLEDIPYIKVTGSVSVCLCVLRIVLIYSEGSYMS